MGKGDKKTKKGKIFAGSYGKLRPRKTAKTTFVHPSKNSPEKKVEKEKNEPKKSKKKE